MDINGDLSLRWNVTISLVLSLCLIFATLHGGTADAIGAPYTSSVSKSDTTTICDCPMSSSFMTCQTSAEECESEEVQHGDSCYRFVTEMPKTHEESLLDCIVRNSHLVYIESMEEQNFIVSHASSSIGIDYWIGLVAKVTYIWSDGSLKLPDLFTIIESAGAGDCVHVVRFSHSLFFYTSNCNQRRNFVCESDTTPTGCPNHWHPFGESCYEIVRGSGQQRTQDAARRFCQDRGGHLVHIETMDELDDLRNQLPNGVSYWIGLTVVRYHWMDGSLALFQTFESANGDDGNECFRMRPRSLNWNDRGCHNLFGYICERRLSMAPSSRIIDQSVECPPSTPSDLMLLIQSGAMCIDDDDGTIPILRSCDTWDGIDECGCGTTNDDLISCSVGFCQMTFSNTDKRWPSKFNCSCSSDNGNFSFNLTADQGSIGCLVQLPPPTTSMSTTSLLTTTLPTTTQSSTSTSTVIPTTVEVTSDRVMAETTDFITAETTTQSQRTTVSVDASTEISMTTSQITTQSTESNSQTTSRTTLLTDVVTSADMTASSTVEGTMRTTVSPSEDQTSILLSTREDSTSVSPSATGRFTTQPAEGGAASGRRGDDSSTGLTVGVTVAAVSVVGVVVGSLVWKKLGGNLALKTSKGLGSSLSPSSQLSGSPNAGVNPMYGFSEDTLVAGSDILAGVSEGGVYGVRNPIYEGGAGNGDVDPLEV